MWKSRDHSALRHLWASHHVPDVSSSSEEPRDKRLMEIVDSSAYLCVIIEETFAQWRLV